MLAGLVCAAVPAFAGRPAVNGSLCQYAAVADPTLEPDTWTGVLAAGPVLLTEADGTPAAGTLQCRVQVNTFDHMGTGPSVTTHGTGVLAAEQTINYSAAAGEAVDVCAEFVSDADGTTYYWDGGNAEWSTSPTVSCGADADGTVGAPGGIPALPELPLIESSYTPTSLVVPLEEVDVANIPQVPDDDPDPDHRELVPDWSDPDPAPPALMPPPASVTIGEPPLLDLHGREMRPMTTSYGSYAGLGNTGWVPSDVNAAAGPNHVVEVVNSNIAIYNRTGASQYTTSLKSWFGKSTKQFDPHVIFEPRGQRFVTMDDDNGDNWVVQAATSANPLASWCRVTINAKGSGVFADSPFLGSDDRYVYASMVVFSSAGPGGTVTDSRLVAIPRNDIETCPSSTTVLIWSGIKDPGLSRFTEPLVPAVNYVTADKNGYFVDSYFDGGSHMSLWYINSTDTTLRGRRVATSAYGNITTKAPQGGSTTKIDTGTTRARQAVYYGSGLYTAITGQYDWGSGNNNTVVWWFKFDPKPGVQSMTSSGGFGYPGNWWTYPAMAQNSNGDAMFVATLSGASLKVSSAYGTLDTANKLGTFYYLNSGGFTYAPSSDSDCSGTRGCRWGDYQSAQVDPADTTKFWVAAETTTANDVWGTRFARVGM